jgi:hypothetical protein
MRDKKSPLKQTPLRVPGQSSDEAIERLISDEETKYVVYCVGFFTIAMLEWYRYIFNAPYSPVLTSIVAAIVIGYGILRIRSIRRDIRDHILGREGERAVAEILDVLRLRGYGVLHDIVGDDFNIDHVIISPQGIFVIETKTARKVKGEKVRVDHGELYIGNNSWGEKPIKQSIAVGEWIEELLKSSTGKNFPVRSVLVFPDWFVEPIPNDLKEHLWILNPKALQSWIELEPKRIPEDDVHLATYHLSRYIRVRSLKSA